MMLAIGGIFWIVYMAVGDNKDNDASTQLYIYTFLICLVVLVVALVLGAIAFRRFCVRKVVLRWEILNFISENKSESENPMIPESP
jgi:predicted Na+-dependent transporter